MVPKPNAKGKVSAKVGGVHATAKLWSLKSENIIRAGVFVVNIMGGLTALETAKKMKGDANAVLTAAEKWRQAALKLSDCENPLFLASNSLQSDWSGPAYGAFDKLMGRNMQVAGDNAAALLGAEMALLDLSVQVTNTYNSAVDLTTLAASRIQPALGGIGLTGAKKDDKPSIIEALTDYINAINSTDTKLRSAIESQKVGLAKFANELAKLKPPAEMSSSIQNPKRWIYQ